MSTLSTELRNKLERTIVQAREAAEAGAKAALEAIAVHHHEPYVHMSPEDRKLRNHLRARARQLGDKQNQKGELEITRLVWECAYEHWHRMLFARFLAENDLLIEPEMSVAISLEECEELAKENGKDLWTLASQFAQRMLPQIFRPNDPVLLVTFASEHRLKLENLLNDLEPSIFTTSDSLGWVYQFWQSKRKKEVNQSGNKIGADELPAVTQLFTEPYMVNFLLDNSLGAWWAARCDAGMGRREDGAKGIFERAGTEEEIRKACAIPGVPLEYLRFVKQDNGAWAPAAGTFDRWPEHLSELKTLDPCCGSGHFLVAAFLMLMPMRMEMEGLSARDACDAVLGENLHGLEIDNRCVELAAFTLALAAWGYPNAGGYRPLPELNLACSGLVISAKKEEWLAMADDNTNLRIALEEIYKQFKEAPMLGSLIKPDDGVFRGTLLEIKRKDFRPLLTKALSGEKDLTKTEMGVVAQGIARSSLMMENKYSLVYTNVPYLVRGKHDETLKSHLERYFPTAKHDLAYAFLNRCLDYLHESGNVSIVLPENWLYINPCKKFRKDLIEGATFRFMVRLGPGAFQTISGEVVKGLLLSVEKEKPDHEHEFGGIDSWNASGPEGKSKKIRIGNISLVKQAEQKKNPDCRISIGEIDVGTLLSKVADGLHGQGTFDKSCFVFQFWEIQDFDFIWEPQQSTPVKREFSDYGASQVFRWEHGKGLLYDFMQKKREAGYTSGKWKAGVNIWGENGVAVSGIGYLYIRPYLGKAFDENIAVVHPKRPNNLSGIYSFIESESFEKQLKQIDSNLKASCNTLVKVPFDLDHWNKVAQEKYPNGFPKPYSDDPTQWIFHGYPAQSAEPLQVATVRLLGYRWPAELDRSIELSEEAYVYVKKSESLSFFSDEDGIVCIPPVRGEESAVTRLHELMAVALGPSWSTAKEHELITATQANASNLDEWLRNHFFEQHCKLFHHRPFIWHIWDGRRRDGFHALVNYHKLAEGNGKGRQLLENLTYSYLGEWITRQREGVKRGEGGAEDRLAAALELQKRLIAIIGGEPPFDIFVRWKLIEKQPIGWEPDINDGVRINIRPFMADDIPGGRNGSGILRWKPNIKWGKDRGKDVASAPWFPLFKGDRINDYHLSLEEKRAARAEARGRGGETENG